MIAKPPSCDSVGVVLAGGRSSRLGRDKTTLRWSGEALVSRAVRRLRSRCRTVVVADRGRGLVPGVESVEDGPGRGPAAGVLGVASKHPGCPLLVLACDLPQVSVELIAALAQPPAGCDLWWPRWQRGVEPLCAWYGPRAIDALVAQVSGGHFALHRLQAGRGLDVRDLEGAHLARTGVPEVLFANLNTPADAARLGIGLEASAEG